MKRLTTEELSYARFYLEGIGYAARSSVANSDVNLWRERERKLNKAIVIGAILLSVHIAPKDNWGEHFWITPREARFLWNKIQNHRGLLMSSGIELPKDQSSTLGWLRQFLKAAGFKTQEAMSPDERKVFRVDPKCIDGWLKRTEKIYRQFLPPGQYVPNWSEAGWLDTNIAPRPEWSAQLEGGEE